MPFRPDINQKKYPNPNPPRESPALKIDRNSKSNLYVHGPDLLIIITLRMLATFIEESPKF